MIESSAQFIQGIVPFSGRGYQSPLPLGPEMGYVVPADRRAQLIYFRAGNSSSDMIYVALMRDGKLMRSFPLGAKSAMHVPLAVVEDLFPETKLTLLVGAPEGVSGTLVLDLGLMEI